MIKPKSDIKSLVLIVALLLGMASAISLLGCAAPDAKNENTNSPNVNKGALKEGESSQLSGSNEIDTNLLPDSSVLYETTILELANADVFNDNQTVQVVGEAMGEALNITGDPDHKWVTLASLDKKHSATLIVYMKTSDANLITSYGKYGSQGCLVQAQGEFKLVSEDHSGITCLEASHVAIMSKGYEIQESFHIEDFFPGAILISFALCLALWLRRLRIKRR